MSAWFNEIDEYAAQWLRNLMVAGHIADGVVDNAIVPQVAKEVIAAYMACRP